MTRFRLGQLILATVMLGTTPSAQSSDADVLAFFKTYDAAFSAMDLNSLGALHHPDVTRYEGSLVNTG